MSVNLVPGFIDPKHPSSFRSVDPPRIEELRSLNTSKQVFSPTELDALALGRSLDRFLPKNPDRLRLRAPQRRIAHAQAFHRALHIIVDRCAMEPSHSLVSVMGSFLSTHILTHEAIHHRILNDRD